MNDEYLWDRTGDDPEVAGLERLLGGLAHDAPLAPLPPRSPRSPRGRWVAVAAVGLAAAAAAAYLVARRPGPPRCGSDTGFAFAIRGGAARCGGGVATGRGVLPVGAWLETPADATADVTVADIGALTLAGGSRLRLVATGAAEHRLELAAGALSARVTAPPRLFVVDTPAARAVDLGCAYDLAVLADGRTRLTVTSGVVELASHDRIAHVTVGATVTTVPGRGPGTPVRVDAPPALADAVARYDAGDAASLAPALAAAGAADTLTVWNLLANAPPPERAAVLARLDQLFPRPEWILERDVVAGQRAAIDGLRDVLTSAVWLAPSDDAPPDGRAPSKK
ncbi:MAG: FecR family protein [Kofleriaceae bacterium]